MSRFLRMACALGLLIAVPGCAVFEGALKRFGTSDGEFDNGPLFATNYGGRISLNVLTPDGKIAFLDRFSSSGDIFEDAISPGRSWVYDKGPGFLLVRSTTDVSNDSEIYLTSPRSELVFGAADANPCDLSNVEGDVVSRIEDQLRQSLGINEVPDYEFSVAPVFVYRTERFETGGLDWIGWLSDSELVVSGYAGIFVEYEYGTSPSVSSSYLQTLTDLQYLTVAYSETEGWQTIACADTQPTIPPFRGPASVLSLDGTQLLINGDPAIVARTEDIIYAEPISQISREVARRVRP